MSDPRSSRERRTGVNIGFIEQEHQEKVEALIARLKSLDEAGDKCIELTVRRLATTEIMNESANYCDRIYYFGHGLIDSDGDFGFGTYDMNDENRPEDEFLDNLSGRQPGGWHVYAGISACYSMNLVSEARREQYRNENVTVNSELDTYGREEYQSVAVGAFLNDLKYEADFHADWDCPCTEPKKVCVILGPRVIRRDPKFKIPYEGQP
jgi:hypothetical protein